MKRINHCLLIVREHTQRSLLNMEHFMETNKHLPNYQTFIQTTQKHYQQLCEINVLTQHITPFSVSMEKGFSIGNMLQLFYQLHSHPQYEKALLYSVGFEGYISNIYGIYMNKKGQYVNNAVFSDKKETKMVKQYYPAHKYLNPIPNNCDLKKNMIISGVNASGKTTYLKMTAINIIFTQQFGVGFYNNCVLRPYTHIHSYLNIPDTSGRDSLFQAESRRCKDIINSIQNTPPSSRHFCIFDELYSGTNPEEATKSSYSFLKYLSTFSNVRFVLTTHYVSVCKKYKKSKQVSNYKMDVIKGEDGRLKYTYKIKKGISNIHGGIEILKEMNYPSEIINQIEQYK